MKVSAQVGDAIYSLIENIIVTTIDEKEIDELLKNDYGFIEAGSHLALDICEFANNEDNKAACIKNVKFCNPTQFVLPGNIQELRISLETHGDQLVGIFNDFVLYISRKYLGASFERSTFDAEWNKFTEEFFSDYVEIRFYTQLACLSYSAGGLLHDLVKESDIDIRYLRLDQSPERALFFYLKNSIERAHLQIDPKEFSSSVPIIVEWKMQASKLEKLESYFKAAADLFEKIAFITRLVCGGSVHFDFIKPVMFGSLSTCQGVIHTYPLNHTLVSLEQSTNIDQWAYGIWINKLWMNIKPRKASEWQFVNSKIRDFATRIKREDPYYPFDEEYQFIKQLEKIIDLIQALENTIGSSGKRNSKYMGKILEVNKSYKRADVEKTISQLYDLRNKYMHGNSDKLAKLYQDFYQQNIIRLEAEIRHLEIFLREALMFSIMNVNLLSSMKRFQDQVAFPKHCTDKQKDVLLTKSVDGATFPTFNSIYN